MPNLDKLIEEIPKIKFFMTVYFQTCPQESSIFVFKEKNSIYIPLNRIFRILLQRQFQTVQIWLIFWRFGFGEA